MTGLRMTGLPLPALDTELPWLSSVQSALDAAIRADRLGHALLVQVAPGLGGEWLATWLAARIFCQQGRTGGRAPCGQCLDCRRVTLGEQPDLLLVGPIEDSKEIRIDQVRELVAELALTSHGGGRKVAILAPADKLNRAAANALLKTLEEPTPGSLLVLVTGEPSRLPVTVLSRCTRLQIPMPDIMTLVSWLGQHGDRQTDWAKLLQVIGAMPIEALQADRASILQLQGDTVRALEQAVAGKLDPVETAEAWGKEHYALRLACIESWLTSGIRDWASGRQGIAVQNLFMALDETREARQWADTPINKPLALERLLWRLSSTSTARPTTTARSTVTSRRPA